MIRLLAGDCRDVLPTLAAGSVHCVVTSPPYYGLRDYGTAQWDGGDANCPHTFARNDTRLMLGSDGTLGKNCTSWTHRDATPPRQCSCGARRIDRQLGLEATPDEYIATMVAVFRQLRRVMRDDAPLFLNMGDGYQDKQLLGMPWRLAFALQADGWWLRSDIIISKRNPMPESVTDRCTSAHEHLFMFTKSPRYYFDNEAIREGVTGGANPQGSRTTNGKMAEPGNGIRFNSSFSMAINNATRADMPTTRNRRDVWEISTFPYKEAHFATFSPVIPEVAIKAGTSERGCCAACGAPWVRQTERISAGKSIAGPKSQAKRDMGLATAFSGYDDGSIAPVFITTGWCASCQCNAATRPAVVLDPFAGAGTVGLVADRLQRDAVQIELNPAYVAMMRERIVADAPLLAEVAD